MVPVTLPPELIYDILDSIHFSSHDLANIALAHRNFLSLARHNLYNHIEITVERVERERLGVLAGDSRPGSVDLRILRPQPLEVFLLNISLHPFVKKVSLNGDKFRGIGEVTSMATVKTILDTLLFVEELILDHWLWLSTEMSELLLGQQNRRDGASERRVHMRAAYDCYDEEDGTFEVPLLSFDASYCAGSFDQTALTSSRFSLRALGFYIGSRLRYQDFPNVTTLRIGVVNFEGSDLISDVLQIFENFQHVKSLLFARSHHSPDNINALIHLLVHCLPVTLRRLYLEGDFGNDDVEKIVAARADNSSLRQLTFRPLFEGPAIAKAVAKVNASRSREQLEITVDQLRRVWEDLCTFNQSL